MQRYGYKLLCLVTKLYGGQFPRTHKNNDEKHPDYKSVRAHIEVVSSTTSAQREIEGTEKLTDVTSDAGELADT